MKALLLRLDSHSDRSAIGRRIYKIRNQLVHPEDYTDRSVLNTPESEFRLLSTYLCAIALRIYSDFDPILRKATLA